MSPFFHSNKVQFDLTRYYFLMSKCRILHPQPHKRSMWIHFNGKMPTLKNMYLYFLWGLRVFFCHLSDTRYFFVLSAALLWAFRRLPSDLLHDSLCWKIKNILAVKTYSVVPGISFKVVWTMCPKCQNKCLGPIIVTWIYHQFELLLIFWDHSNQAHVSKAWRSSIQGIVFFRLKRPDIVW